MSALPPKADIFSVKIDVCFVPEADRHVCFTPESGHAHVGINVRYVPKAAVSNRSTAAQLFDHLVGAGE